MAKPQTSEKSFIDWLNATLNVYHVAAEYHVVPRTDSARDCQCFCPFHPNVDTPSARLYTGTNNLHCYSCQRNYGPYDFLTVLGGMSHTDILRKYGSAWEEHERQRRESLVLDSQREMFVAAAGDSRQRQTLRDFQEELTGAMLTSKAYRAWRAGEGGFKDVAAEFDRQLTNDFQGYDYVQILRGG